MPRSAPKLLVLMAACAVTAVAAPGALAQTEPPAALELEVFMGDIALRQGVFEVRGTIECSQPAFAALRVEVTEGGQPVAVGVGDANCVTESESWRVLASRDDGRPISEGSFDVTVRAEALDRPYSTYTGQDRYVVAEDTAGMDQSLDEATAEDADAEAAEAGQSAEAADGLTVFIARDPALSLLLWFASLVAVVLATALVTLRVIGRRAGPGPD